MPLKKTSSFFIFTTMQNKAIGIFDSGVGGSSIWKEIHQLLPYENTIYLADSKNAPYGEKPIEEIISLSIKNTEVLLQMGCKIIVVACNTATTNAIAVLRKSFDIPFIGIEPAIKPASLKTQTKSIGILATKGTLSSALFHSSSQKFTQQIKVTEIVGKGLVPLIEKGLLEDSKIISLLKTYLQPMIKANVDYLVLGCSHYPFLLPQIKKILPTHITIIDSGASVAKQTQHILSKNNLLNSNNCKPTLKFFTNKEIETLEELLVDYKNDILIEKKEF